MFVLLFNGENDVIVVFISLRGEAGARFDCFYYYYLSRGYGVLAPHFSSLIYLKTQK